VPSASELPGQGAAAWAEVAMMVVIAARIAAHDLRVGMSSLL